MGIFEGSLTEIPPANNVISNIYFNKRLIEESFNVTSNPNIAILPPLLSLHRVNVGNVK